MVWDMWWCEDLEEGEGREEQERPVSNFAQVSIFALGACVRDRGKQRGQTKKL